MFRNVIEIKFIHHNKLSLAKHLLINLKNGLQGLVKFLILIQFLNTLFLIFNMKYI